MSSGSELVLCQEAVEKGIRYGPAQDGTAGPRCCSAVSGACAFIPVLLLTQDSTDVSKTVMYGTSSVGVTTVFCYYTVLCFCSSTCVIVWVQLPGGVNGELGTVSCAAAAVSRLGHPPQSLPAPRGGGCKPHGMKPVLQH